MTTLAQTALDEAAAQMAASGMPPISPVETDELPSATEVVVIGGGMIGVGTALKLARRGIAVTVVDKGLVAAEQSGRNWGWCRSQNRHPAELSMMLRSLDLWDGMAADLDEDVGFRRSGALHLAETAEELARLTAWQRDNASSPHGTVILGTDEVAERLPRAKAYIGGAFTAVDGVAEPQRVVPALARAARRAGVRIVQGCAALRIDIQSGRVRGVTTERGNIAASRVLVAAGLWSARLCRPIGVRLPQLRLHSTVCRVTLDAPPTFPIVAPGFSLRPRMDGGSTMSMGLTAIADLTPDSVRYFRDFLPVLLDRDAYGVRLRVGLRFLREFAPPARLFRRERVYDVHARSGDVAAACRAAEQSLGLKVQEVTHRWGGDFDVTPDALPVIDEASGVAGLFLSTGYSGHGFGLGPAAAEATAGLIAGDIAVDTCAAFRLNRFVRG